MKCAEDKKGGGVSKVFSFTALLSDFMIFLTLINGQTMTGAHL